MLPPSLVAHLTVASQLWQLQLPCPLEWRSWVVLLRLLFGKMVERALLLSRVPVPRATPLPAKDQSQPTYTTVICDWSNIVYMCVCVSMPCV